MPRRAEFPDKRLLGDTRYMLVHDLDNERPLCGINALIQAGAGQTFEPDSINEATRVGYDACESCMGV